MNLSARTQNVSIILILILLAAVLRIHGIGWELPQVYEEATPLNKAWKMWGWGPGKSFDLNPHFFNYPSLIIYLQFLGQGLLYLGMKLFGLVDSTIDYRVLYIVHKTPFYLMGRAITALFGVATVWVTFLTGRRIAGQAAAIPAALFIAINTFHISSSQAVEVDVPLTFFTILNLWLAMRLLDAPTKTNYILAGLVLGLATSAKYTAAILILPLLATHLIARRVNGRSRRPNAAPGKRKPPWAFLALALTAALLAFAATSPFVLLDATTFSMHLSLERQHMSIGHFGLDASRTWLFYLQSLTGTILGWPLALLALAGLVYLAFIRRRAWALVMAAFLVPYLIVVGSWSMKADRYLLPIIPVVLLFAGGMFAEVLRLRRFSMVPGAWRLGAATIAVLLLGAPLVAAYPDHLNRLRPDTRTEAKEWIEANVRSGSFIVVESYGPELFGPHELRQLEDAVRKRVLERKSNTPHYAIQPLPMFQTNPERSEAFYDFSLYEVADVIITSSWVRSRYLKEPARFRHQVAFYDSLDALFDEIYEIIPQGQSGPTVTVYKNQRHNIPFAGRRNVQGPRPLRYSSRKPSGSEELFYNNLAANYEAFKFYKEALACYELAFEYPIYRSTAYNSLVIGKTQCLLNLGRPEEAAEFLRDAAADARSREAHEQFLRLRRRILSRMRRKG